MPPKVPFYTEQQLRDVTLPTHGGRYAVVPHGEIIDTRTLAYLFLDLTTKFYDL